MLLSKRPSRGLGLALKTACLTHFNVRFEGEIIPVDLILSDITEQYGFRIDKVSVARYNGNSSQQMGKYGRLPVRESVLYWTKR